MHGNHQISIELRDTASLIPYAKNSRLHSAEQVAQIARSIETFGFTNPILIDGENIIIAGHGRLAAAKQLSLPQVPTITLSHLNDAQRRALVIADNKIAENATWDFDTLKFELDAIDHLGIDLSVIGFSIGELGDIFNPVGAEPDGSEQESEPKPVTCPECNCKFIPKKGKKHG